MLVSCARAGQNKRVIICVAMYVCRSLKNAHPLSWKCHHTIPPTIWVRISVISVLYYSLLIHAFKKWKTNSRMRGSSPTQQCRQSSEYTRSSKTNPSCYHMTDTSSLLFISQGFPSFKLTTHSSVATRERIHNEAFRYHGTTRNCNLGLAGNTRICESSSCPLCSILKTSFKTSLASPTGA